MPEGLLYQEEFLSRDDEAGLLAGIRRLPLEEAKYKSFTAKRRIAAFGSSYDLIQVHEEAIRHALVNEYRPGTELGWHRDIGEFGIVVGISLAGSCRMRFGAILRQRRRRSSASISRRARSTCCATRSAGAGSTASRPPRSCATPSPSELRIDAEGR